MALYLPQSTKRTLPNELQDVTAITATISLLRAAHHNLTVHS